MIIFGVNMGETFEYVISIKIPEDDLKAIADEIKKDLEESETLKLRGGIKVKSMQVASATLDSAWKYFLTYYPDTGDLTITVKRFEKQPTSYAIIKVTDKVVEAEDFNNFVERMAKTYLLLKYLRRDLIGKEVKKGVKSFF